LGFDLSTEAARRPDHSKQILMFMDALLHQLNRDDTDASPFLAVTLNFRFGSECINDLLACREIV
jgi:hypothetical protein